MENNNLSIRETKKDVASLLQNSQNILVVGSSPDGDSIGASLAILGMLKSIGKNATAILNGNVPNTYKFLKDVELLKESLSEEGRDFIITIDCTKNPVKGLKWSVDNGKLNIVIIPEKGSVLTENLVSFKKSKPAYDLIVTLDTADLFMLGDIYSKNKDIFSEIKIINIDHHISNTMFGNLNLVDTESTSTCEILFDLFSYMNIKISSDTATALLTGILFDTKTFQNPNTTPKSLTISAQLMSFGANRKEIINSVYRSKPFSLLKLWGRILERIKKDEEYSLIWSFAKVSDFQEFGLNPKEGLDNFIDELLVGVPNINISFLLTEKSPGFVSCSLRTDKDIDLNKIAEKFGGGGHKKAAGLRIVQKTLPECEEMILKEIRRYLEEAGIVQINYHQKKVEEPLQSDGVESNISELNDTKHEEVTEIEQEQAEEDEIDPNYELDTFSYSDEPSSTDSNLQHNNLNISLVNDNDYSVTGSSNQQRNDTIDNDSSNTENFKLDDFLDSIQNQSGYDNKSPDASPEDINFPVPPPDMQFIPPDSKTNKNQSSKTSPSDFLDDLLS